MKKFIVLFVFIMQFSCFGLDRINEKCFMYEDSSLETKIGSLNIGCRVVITGHEKESLQIRFTDGNLYMVGFIPKGVTVSESFYNGYYGATGYKIERIITQNIIKTNGEKTYLYLDSDFENEIGYFYAPTLLDYNNKKDNEYSIRYKTNRIEVRGFVKIEEGTQTAGGDNSTGEHDAKAGNTSKGFTPPQARKLEALKKLIEHKKDKIRSDAKKYGFTKKRVKCTFCGGSGGTVEKTTGNLFKSTSKRKCKMCKGRGYIYKTKKSSSFKKYEEKADSLKVYEDEVNAITPETYNDGKVNRLRKTIDETF